MSEAWVEMWVNRHARVGGKSSIEVIGGVRDGGIRLEPQWNRLVERLGGDNGVNDAKREVRRGGDGRQMWFRCSLGRSRVV